jgi:ribosomal protein S18 acetylase RimI-like enzyme
MVTRPRGLRKPSADKLAILTRLRPHAPGWINSTRCIRFRGETSRIVAAMPTIVRRAVMQDADTLSMLNADVQDLHAAALPWLFKRPAPDTFPPETAADVLAASENIVFIAESDGVASGYAFAEIIRRPETSFHHANDVVHLHHISVRPAYRRKGVGAALIDAVRSAAAEAGIDIVSLDVWTFNEEARAFFRSRGFAQFSERYWNRMP